MKNDQVIQFIDKKSPADRAGIHIGETLLKINNEPVIDMIDYTYLSTQEVLDVELLTAEGKTRNVHIRKELYEPLGMGFSTTLMSEVRTCSNRCIFCFVDQMPKDMRSSLYVKDDDWRMSFIMGNYITLTNTSDSEFLRIIRRKVSPLYISVHSTDPQTRINMMGNRTAGKILERLRSLYENGITFHTQIVLCPGINDGENLKNTFNDLISMYPYCKTCAVVPVGLTKFRENLTELNTFDKEASLRVIQIIREFQNRCMEKFGSRVIYLSDEWYLKSGLELPSYEEYEDFDQIENGVGLLRLAEHEFLEGLSEKKPLHEKRTCNIAGGAGCYPFFQRLYEKLHDYNIEVNLFPIQNNYFGGNVNVAGLVTGSDIISQMKGKELSGALYIPRNMLREKENVFLDNVSLNELEKVLGVPVIPFSDSEIIDYLFGEHV